MTSISSQRVEERSSRLVIEDYQEEASFDNNFKMKSELKRRRTRDTNMEDNLMTRRRTRRRVEKRITNSLERQLRVSTIITFIFISLFLLLTLIRSGLATTNTNMGASNPPQISSTIISRLVEQEQATRNIIKGKLSLSFLSCQKKKISFYF